MHKRAYDFVSVVLTYILSALVAGTCALGGDAAPAAKKVPWKISGQLEEACSCNAACPCWFNSLPSRMNCGGVQVLFIKNGHYGKVKLDGLAMSHFGQSPDGQTMMESFGKWNFSYLYIDEKATPEQREALEAIARPCCRTRRRARRRSSTCRLPRRRGKDNKIAVGGCGTIAGHLVEGGLGGHPKIVNPPAADPIHREYLQGRRRSLPTTMPARTGTGKIRITCAGSSRWTASSMKNSPPAWRRKWRE